MRTLPAALAASILTLLAIVPAQSWELGMSEAGDVFWTIAMDQTGETRLSFFCSQVVPGNVLVQFAIDQPGPSGAVPIELGFEVAGRSYGPIAGRAETVNGGLVVTANGGEATIGDAARAVYQQDGDIVLNYYESVWRFDGAAYSDSFGAMLDACG